MNQKKQPPEVFCKKSNKSEITGFYTGKNSKFTGSFPQVVLCDIDFRSFFDVAFDPDIFSTVRLW